MHPLTEPAVKRMVREAFVAATVQRTRSAFHVAVRVCDGDVMTASLGPSVSAPSRGHSVVGNATSSSRPSHARTRPTLRNWGLADSRPSMQSMWRRALPHSPLPPARGGTALFSTSPATVAAFRESVHDGRPRPPPRPPPNQAVVGAASSAGASPGPRSPPGSTQRDAAPRQRGERTHG